LCPQGIYEITIEAWGGGGGGSSYMCSNANCNYAPTCYASGSGGTGGYNASIISVKPGSRYKIDIGAGGCSSASGSPTKFGDSLVIAQPGTGSYGGANNTRAGAYNGSPGSIVNWPYENWIVSSNRSYISSTLYVNSVSKPSLAKGGAGGCTCSATKGEDGFLIIKY
jgi:hypothetical protein